MTHSNYPSGAYALILRSQTTQHITIGSLGDLAVRVGYYVYVGSALGPGGLAGRLRHHLAPVRTPHWHIDYLRQAAQVVEIWYAPGQSRYEHAWASALAAMPGASLPLGRFGASDCTCPAHLFHFASPPSLTFFQSRVAAEVQRLRLPADTAKDPYEAHIAR